MDDKTRELVRNLNQPHRVNNVMALFRFCEEAAAVIEDQNAQINALKNAPAPKAKTKRSAAS